jgi:hypothetical protein
VSRGRGALPVRRRLALTRAGALLVILPRSGDVAVRADGVLLVMLARPPMWRAGAVHDCGYRDRKRLVGGSVAFLLCWRIPESRRTA